MVVTTPSGSDSFSGFTFNAGTPAFPGDPTYDGLLFPTGTQQTLTDGGYDDGYVTLTPAFPVSIYEKDLTTIHVNTNGMISENTSSDFSNSSLNQIEASNPGYYIAGLWQDIGSDIYYYQETGVESITWLGRTFYNLDVPSIFQVVFFGAGNSYGVTPGSFAIAWGEAGDFAGATVGVSKNDSTTFLSPNALVDDISSTGIADGSIPPELGANGNVLYTPDGSGSYNLTYVQPPQVWEFDGFFTFTDAVPQNDAVNTTSFGRKTGYKGTTFTITGTKLDTTTSVTFGGIPAESFTVINPETIEAVVAENSPNGNIQISDGTQTLSIGGFRYAPIVEVPVADALNTFADIFIQEKSFVTRRYSLAAPPTNNVTLDFEVNEGVYEPYIDQYSVTFTELPTIFTPGNWNIPVNVTYNAGVSPGAGTTFNNSFFSLDSTDPLFNIAQAKTSQGNELRTVIIQNNGSPGSIDLGTVTSTNTSAPFTRTSNPQAGSALIAPVTIDLPSGIVFPTGLTITGFPITFTSPSTPTGTITVTATAGTPSGTYQYPVLVSSSDPNFDRFRKSMSITVL